MKRAILIALGVIAVCSLCLAGTVSAARAEEFRIYQGTADPTVDGAVSPADMWDEAYKDWLYDGGTMSTSFFRDKWGGDFATVGIFEFWLVEVLTDTTSDAGDFVQMSVDCSVDFGSPPVGGAAPTTQCFMVTITGHPGTVTIQKGTGTGWGPFAEAVIGTDVIVATSMASGHWVIEIQLLKTSTLAMGYLNNARIATYDASTGKTLMWPSYTSADVPDTYGTGVTGGAIDETVPEGLTVGVMLAVSSVAVVVSVRYFRKQPKI
jgi:hypothetical protein